MLEGQIFEWLMDKGQGADWTLNLNISLVTHGQVYIEEKKEIHRYEYFQY